MQRVLKYWESFPSFEVPALGGGVIRVPEVLAGSHGVVLIYRGSWCSVCNEQFPAFVAAADELKKEDIKVVAFSTDTEEKTAEFVEKYNIDFIMGHSANVAEIVEKTGAYHTDSELWGDHLETTGFVLDPKGKIGAAVYGSFAIGGLIPEEVLQLVSCVMKKMPERLKKMPAD